MNRHRMLPLLAFILIQAVVLTDVLLHDPYTAYDAQEHLRYAATLSTFKLPSPEDSAEFFAPPLPYVVPAVLRATGLVSDWWMAKSGQLMNFVYSIGLCLCIMAICKLTLPDFVSLQFWSLGLLAIVPVYFRTFSMMRGEPLLSFLVAASVYLTLKAYRASTRRWWDFVWLGGLLGLAMLSRQLAFFMFPAIAVFAVLLPASSLMGRLLNLKPLVLSFAVAAAVGGWFYLGLHERYGHVTAFNRPFNPWSLSQRSARFYFSLGLDHLFTDPIRPVFEGEFFPSFYSEFWGDYRCYFVVYGKDSRYGFYWSGPALEDLVARDPPPDWLKTNRFRIAPWIGCAQAVAIFPSALFAIGLAMGTTTLFRRRGGDRAAGLLALVTLSTMLGYLWFLLSLQNPTAGAGIKASYLLDVLPLVAILGARSLLLLRDRSPMMYRVLACMLALSAMFNMPLLFTRYVVFPW
jgi:hypothetical protein